MFKLEDLYCMLSYNKDPIVALLERNFEPKQCISLKWSVNNGWYIRGRHPTAGCVFLVKRCIYINFLLFHVGSLFERGMGSQLHLKGAAHNKSALSLIEERAMKILRNKDEVSAVLRHLQRVS